MTNFKNTELHRILRSAREQKYSTAKKLWQKHRELLAVSYPHYAAVEAGNKYPAAPLAIAISNILDLDLRMICHVWARDQMPTPQTKAFFEPVSTGETRAMPTGFTLNLDNYFICTEKQSSVFAKDPRIWDVLIAVMAYSTSYNLREADLAQMFGYPQGVIQSALEWLGKEGFVTVDRGIFKAKRPFIHVPNTQEFKTLRDLNLRHVSSDLVEKITQEEIVQQRGFRATFMRRLSRKNAIDFCQKLDEIIGQVAHYEISGQELYALAIAFGPRARIHT